MRAWRFRFVFYACLATLAALQTSAAMADLPKDPVLRVETGMHTSPIRRLMADASGQTMITASDDKTLRLWSLDTGRLIKTFRIPVGAADEGRLWSVAMSPTSSWIAAGGYTRGVTNLPGNYHIYLFDRQTGDMTGFLSGLPDGVNHLCVSADGNSLAAGFGSGGMRVWSTRNWEEVARDPHYDDAAVWCDFSTDGRLVTSSRDGEIRLYDASFNLTNRNTPVGGSKPFAVAFSPDGKQIAVGFSDTPKVQVLAGHNLQPSFTPDTRGLDNGSLKAVAWSDNGQRLFAAGGYQTREGKFPIIAWEGAGRGQRRIWPAAKNSIADLRSLPGGGLLVGTDDPAWMKFAADGSVLTKREAVVPDQRNKLGEHFQVSANGRQVAFGLGYGGENMALFDLDAKRVFEGHINETWLLQTKLSEFGLDPGAIDGQMGPMTASALSQWRSQNGLGSGGLDDAARTRLGLSPLRPAREDAPGLRMTNWQNSSQPLLGGQPLPLAPYEFARSLAIAPNGASFALGTDFYLRRFDKDGQQIWAIPVPDPAWGVNVTANGRLVVAALGDGTIRWYRYDDGQELLALFIHKGTREWVAWTPSGYYDASPGGDRLIGWHLNRFEAGEGLYLLRINPGSAAAQAGLKQGDIIQSINGTPVATQNDLKALLPQGTQDNPLDFSIVRGADALILPVIPQRAAPGEPPRLGAYVGDYLKGASAADFYPVSNFRERFYRPSIVASILDTQDEDKAIARANQSGKKTIPQTSVAQSLPPMVKILSPQDGSSFNQGATRLRYRVRNDASANATPKIQVLIDGRPLDRTRGLRRVRADAPQQASQQTSNQAPNTDGKAPDDAYDVDIELPARDVEVTLIAENQFGASPPETIRLHWAGDQQQEFVIQPVLYALVSGVSDYDNDALDLAFAAKDATDFSDALARQKEGIYRDVKIKTLTDPGIDNFLDGLDWLRSQVTSKDVAILFVSGHGENDADGDYFYLTKDVDVERLRRTAIPYYEIKKTLSSLPGKVLAFIDTCHSGNVMGARRGVTDVTAVINDLVSAEHGVVVFASSTGKQYSLENPEWGNGAFTKALIEGLDGAADYTKDGSITINQLDLYLSERVKELTNNKQTPTTTKPQTISDFPIALKH